MKTEALGWDVGRVFPSRWGKNLEEVVSCCQKNFLKLFSANDVFWCSFTVHGYPVPEGFSAHLRVKLEKNGMTGILASIAAGCGTEWSIIETFHQ